MPTVTAKTTNFCLRCEKDFESESESPKSCRLCHSALWNQPRKNKVGQGRKRKGYVKIEYIETPGMLEDLYKGN